MYSSPNKWALRLNGMQLFINITSSDKAFRVMRRARLALGLIVLYTVVMLLSPSRPLPDLLSSEHQHIIQTATFAAQVGVLAWIIWCDFKFRRHQFGQTPWLFAFAVFELLGKVSVPLAQINLLEILLLIPSSIILLNMVQAWRFFRKTKKAP